MPEDDRRHRKVPFYMHMPLTYFMVRQLFRFDVKCRACGHGGHVYLTTFINKYGTEERLENVVLKCKRCKSKDCSVTPDVHFKPQGSIIPFPKKNF